MTGGSEDLDLVLQDLDLLPHLSCLLGAGLDQVHALVALVLDHVVQLGKLS